MIMQAHNFAIPLPKDTWMLHKPTLKQDANNY